MLGTPSRRGRSNCHLSLVCQVGVGPGLIAVVERGDASCHLVQDVEMPLVARGPLDEVEEDWLSYSSRSCANGASSVIGI
jgi:hypothetical protein